MNITLNGLVDDGDGRQASMQKRVEMQSRIAATIVVGASPRNGSVVEFHLIRKVAGIADDEAGDSDAPITLVNATLLDTIRVDATSDKTYKKVIDTSVAGPLTEEWTIAVKNLTGADLNVAGNSLVRQDYA